ncbi:transmembrane protein 242 isoform X3 [Takifugu rubripes]|uniref:transmembrane protein 242 isoform X3 n=1 Tax=Takifugu rubripes TaxID=31033 RepID=UPI0011452CED|nr:transmembrane protein 242 isoform X3 [Takifugu rubripes]
MTIASENTLTNEVEKKNEQQHELQTLKGAVFLATVASAGMMAGFGSTLALAKKRSPEWFNKLTEFRLKMASFFPPVPKTAESAAGSGCHEWDSVFKSK